jgi:hypothetical protein
MRAVFLLLLLANVAFFAYAHWLRTPDAAAQLIPRLEVHPEAIKVIHPSEAQRVSGARRPAPAEACVQWGSFAGAEAARAEAAVSALGLPKLAVERLSVDATGYWVYLPPAKTRADVDRRVRDLKAHGVQDFYVVQDDGQWHNAISLGIFKSEEMARAMAASIAKRGVAGVLLEPRVNFLKQTAYFVRYPGDAAIGRLTELQRNFPGSEVKAVPCPPLPAEAG